MDVLFITKVRGKHATKSDFGAEPCGTQLLVPQDIADVLRDASVRTAEEFVSFVHAFPGAIAAALGWEVREVIRAEEGLAKRLRGFIPDEVLDSQDKVIERSYGALDPWQIRSRR